MKKVVCGDELKRKIDDAIDLMCNAVSSTIGPVGNNVLVNIDDDTPFITNDGVSIARAIEDEDMVTNTILEIIREASLKTNEVVGDGTTTTLVLVQSLYKEGRKLIDEGINPIILKNNMNNILNKLINNLQRIKKIPKKNNLEDIACISTNDNYLGKFVSDVFSKMKSKAAIRLEESYDMNVSYIIRKGYSFDIEEISYLYFKECEEIVLKECYVLILRGYLESLDDISDIINEGILRSKNIIILVSDYNNELNNEVVLYYLRENINIFVFKVAEYGSRREDILEDLSVISSTSIKNIGIDDLEWNLLGNVQEVIISKENVIFINDNNSVLERIDNLKKKLMKTTSQYEKDFLSLRIAKMENGIATIYVGGNTSTEAREVMMRIEDALCSLEVASNGVVPGEGVSLLYIANMLDDDEYSEMFKNALSIPFKKIIENAGIDSSLILNNIKNADYKLVYNINKGCYEDIFDTGIIDSYMVVCESIRNAISISSLLLTTNYIVINDKYSKENVEM